MVTATAALVDVVVTAQLVQAVPFNARLTSSLATPGRWAGSRTVEASRADAPPLIVTLDDVRARVHLLTSVPENELGEPAGSLSVGDLEALQAAAQALVRSIRDSPGSDVRGR